MIFKVNYSFISFLTYLGVPAQLVAGGPPTMRLDVTLQRLERILPPLGSGLASSTGETFVAACANQGRLHLVGGGREVNSTRVAESDITRIKRKRELLLVGVAGSCSK